MTDTTTAVPRLVESLAAASRRHRLTRKLLVAPSYAAGRELLRRLALVGDGWVGFEVVTTQRLAQKLAQRGLDDARLDVMDRFEQQALLDRALDSALTAEEGVLGELSEGVGFRERVHGAILALRLAGIGPRELDNARFGQWEKKLFLIRVLQRYERLLAARHRADTATLLRLALAYLEHEGTQLPAVLEADQLLLVPGLSMRGLSGEFVSALAARGGRVLETDPVLGLDVPTSLLWGKCGDPSFGSYLYDPDDRDGLGGLDFFCAASIDAELREVLRRVVERGLAWDQVEIVAADGTAYGSALHAIAARLGIPVTYAVGLPIERTRTGRVVQAYLDWIEEGFQAAPIRRLLEAGDLRAPRTRGKHAAAALARRFRSLRVGWGRKRYRSQIREALKGVDRMEPNRQEPEANFERRRDRTQAELEALRSILFPALKATPAVPDRMGEGGDPVSPAEIARGLRAFLRRVPRGRGPDRGAREEVGRILERIEATLNRRTEFRAAVSILRRHLELRVRPEILGDDPDSTGAPWSSTGGALHLSDLEHGGYSGREAVFVVGLDAEQMPGGVGQDAVLLDSDRRVLGSDLPTSAELLREKVFRFAAFFARLRGDVTLSFGAWQATEARTVGPSSVLLQALRLARGDASLTFQDLHHEMSRAISAIPRRGRPALDADDVWMLALDTGAVMKQGVEAVRASFTELDAGLTAAHERTSGEPGPVHGVIEPRPNELDPRTDEDAVLSASRLEALGRCPLRYLHSSILRIYPPDDPELDPDVWLDHRVRGSLLHDVFEATMRTARVDGIKPDEPAFEARALEILSDRIQLLRDEVPIPGEGTLRRETAALSDDVRSFVRMIRSDSPKTVAFEMTFGLDDDEPVTIELEGGRLRLRGAIDRVDEDLAGLHVIDYKTGGAFGYGTDAFDGGRRLQHAIYARAAEQRLGGDVVDGQYHFPTRKGQNQTFTYDRAKLAGVEALLELLMEGVARGHFVPTDNPDDCSFCDFSDICRASRDPYGKTSSPMAEWSKEQVGIPLRPAVEQLKQVRAFED